MRNKKKQTPSWSDVKKAIESLGEQGLLELISDIYNLSKNNQDFLHTRFSIGDDVLAPYKKIIKECMYPDILNEPVRIHNEQNLRSEIIPRQSVIQKAKPNC
jgi:hypothetical protein